VCSIFCRSIDDPCNVSEIESGAVGIYLDVLLFFEYPCLSVSECLHGCVVWFRVHASKL